MTWQIKKMWQFLCTDMVDFCRPSDNYVATYIHSVQHVWPWPMYVVSIILLYGLVWSGHADP